MVLKHRKEKRLVKSSYKHVNISTELELRLKDKSNFPSILHLAREEMERVHLVNCHDFMQNLSFFKQAKLFPPNGLSLSLEVHVLNSNSF